MLRRVSVFASVANVPVVGSVIAPPDPLITGVVSVLFVKVSTPSSVARVPVAGSVIAPPDPLIAGVVRVLFVRVCEVLSVTTEDPPTVAPANTGLSVVERL